MHQNPFDEQIKKALENLPNQVNRSPMGWERLQQRLEQESLIEEDTPISEEEIEEKFDEEIRKKITHYALTPYFQHRHWLQFSERLDEQNERVVWIYKHKLAEISLIVLFFFAMFNFLDNPNVKLSAITKPLLRLGQKEGNYAAVKNELNGENLVNATQLPAVEIKENWSISNAARTPRRNYKKIPLDILKKIDRKIELLPTPTIQKLTFSNLAEMSVPFAPVLFLNKTMASERKSNEISFNYIKPKEKKYWTSVGLIASCDLNQIYTPGEYFLGKKIEEYTTYAISGGGGFTLSRESKKNSVEVGFLYNTKRYHPKKLSIITTNDRGIVFEEKLRNVQMNLIQIPINYRYKFIQKNKINYFAGVGASLNVITQANYDNDRQYLVPDYALRMIDENQPVSPIEKAKKFNAGLFEGGVIQENMYLAAQATLGLEYNITDKVSLFNQAAYQRHITLRGIGANNNSFHTFSIWLGLRRNF